jgi:pimeloyl-ACP methyl ester carboxylesterase
VALFIHGVPLNGYHWRHIIASLKHRRRCIAIDLIGAGIYRDRPSAGRVIYRAGADDRGSAGQTRHRQDRSGRHDSGGAIAQILAAHNPHRLTSLVLINCDIHDGWPPPQVLPLMELSRKGEIARVFGPTAERPDLARERHARGESVPLFHSYAASSRVASSRTRGCSFPRIARHTGAADSAVLGRDREVNQMPMGGV